MAVKRCVHTRTPQNPTLAAGAAALAPCGAVSLAVARSEPSVRPTGATRYDPEQAGGEKGHVLLRLDDGVAPGTGAAPGAAMFDNTAIGDMDWDGKVTRRFPGHAQGRDRLGIRQPDPRQGRRGRGRAADRQQLAVSGRSGSLRLGARGDAARGTRHDDPRRELR